MMENHSGLDDNIKPQYSQNIFKGVLDLDENQEIILEMENIYKQISLFLLKLDNIDDMSYDKFKEIIKSMDNNMSRLEICLDCLSWPEEERKKYESMYNYYRELKQNCMDKMMEKIDKSDFDIREQLQKNFDFLSFMILKISDRKGGDDIFDKLDKSFVSIKTKLDSDEIKEQMTVLEYNSRVDKYNQAMDYVKKAYL